MRLTDKGVGCVWEIWELKEIAGRVWKKNDTMMCRCKEREGFFRSWKCQGYDRCPHYLEKFIYIREWFWNE